VFQYPQFDPVAIHIPIEFDLPLFGTHVGPFGVRWYGLMYLVGFATAWWLGRRRARRTDSPVTPVQLDDLIFYGALGVILGGRIGYMLFYGMDRLLENPLSLFRIWEGGMSFHGGLLGVIVAMGLCARGMRLSYLPLMDFVAPLVPIGLGAGRIGNFVNGELWGKPAEVPWAVIVEGIPRHPSQLYEAGLEGLSLFVIVWTFSARPRPTGAVCGLFLLLYGIFRFAVEFVRLPDEPPGYLAFGWFTMGQLLSLPMLVGGLLLLWTAYTPSRRGPRPKRVSGSDGGGARREGDPAA
jgi:phosphatidylglycerol:prolipoprotein diacylglycerol transferase